MRTLVIGAVAALALSCGSGKQGSAKQEVAAAESRDRPSADAGAPVTCGTKTCAAGEVCCNASCGICTPPGGFCTQQACAADPKAAACTRDEDCRKLSDYCGGCNCLALGAKEPDPVCSSGRRFQCFVDPCMKKAAHCEAGACKLRAE